jgi:hypothetical protein
MLYQTAAGFHQLAENTSSWDCVAERAGANFRFREGL